jgi:NADH dehydrogenase (ubiquinone) Fe-S protein 1
MEIGTYIERLLDSEMSANVVDLCPVGALTAKPNMFANRPWELRSTESVDVMDGLGSALVVDCRGTEVMRVGPRLNEDINEEWISDKTRFAYDGLKRQRLVSPMARRGDSFKPVTWEQALSYTSDVLQDTAGEDVVAVVGKFADGESIMALKDLMTRLEAGTMIHETFAGSNADVQTGYRMNSTIAGIEEADCLLIVGSNPRVEAPVLNARIRYV